MSGLYFRASSRRNIYFYFSYLWLFGELFHLVGSFSERLKKWTGFEFPKLLMAFFHFQGEKFLLFMQGKWYDIRDFTSEKPRTYIVFHKFYRAFFSLLDFGHKIKGFEKDRTTPELCNMEGVLSLNITIGSWQKQCFSKFSNGSF